MQLKWRIKGNVKIFIVHVSELEFDFVIDEIKTSFANSILEKILIRTFLNSSFGLYPSQPFIFDFGGLVFVDCFPFSFFEWKSETLLFPVREENKWEKITVCLTLFLLVSFFLSVSSCTFLTSHAKCSCYS